MESGKSPVVRDPDQEPGSSCPSVPAPPAMESLAQASRSSKGIQAGTSEPGLEGDRTVFVGTSKQNIMIPELSYDPQFKTLRTF